MSADIEKCPFCGSVASVEYNFGTHPWVQCDNLECGATDGKEYDTEIEAVSAWNRRAAIPPVTECAPSLVCCEQYSTNGAGPVCCGEPVTCTIGSPPVPPCARLDTGSCGCTGSCINYFARSQAPAQRQQRAKDQNAHDIGMAHIICDQAGIPPGEIIGRLVALSGKGDAAAARLQLDEVKRRLRGMHGNCDLYQQGYEWALEMVAIVEAIPIEKLATPQTAPSQAKSEGDAP